VGWAVTSRKPVVVKGAGGPGGASHQRRIPMLTMRQYIEHENVERFTKCLSTEIDPAKQTILLKLLIEERAKQAQTTLES
jgi:hypothetical protein